MNVLIREYEDKDFEEVINLWCLCFPEIASEDFRSALERKRRLQPGPFIVAVDSNCVVGTTVGGIDGINGNIYLVAVHPDYRRKKLGTRLLQEIEKHLVAAGAVKLTLQVLYNHIHAREFYQSLGFVVEPHICMAKRIEIL